MHLIPRKYIKMYSIQIPYRQKQASLSDVLYTVSNSAVTLLIPINIANVQLALSKGAQACRAQKNECKSRLATVKTCAALTSKKMETAEIFLVSVW